MTTSGRSPAHHATLAPASRHLLALLRPTVGESDLPQNENEWRDLLRTAAVFGLLPYLDHRFTLLNVSMPAFVKQQSALARALNAQLLLRRRAHLRLLLDELDRQGVPVIVLKGFALAHLAYPSPDCRQMSDVDLLVPQGSLPAMRAAAARLGFGDTETIQSLREMGSPLHEDYTLVKSADGRVRLDIHDAIPSFAPFHVDLNQVWQRSVEVDAAGLKFKVLAAEDFLAHLALHLAHHHSFTSRLLSCLDLRILLESPWAQSLDWEAVTGRAKASGYLHWLQLAMAVSRQVTGATLPKDFLDGTPRDFDLAVDVAIEQCLYAGRTEINSNFMDMVSAPSLKRLVRWRREFQDVHAETSSEGKRRPGSRFWRHFRRLRWFLSREGLSLQGWRNAIKTARSRQELLRLTSDW